MRWWIVVERVVATLLLAPIVWQLAATYLGATTGGNVDELAQASLASVPEIYFLYTLPALAIVALVLLPADRLLALIGANLLIVVLAPILAVAVPVVLSLFIDDPRLDAAAIRYLAFAYGLVFGLTAREPAPMAHMARQKDQSA